MTMNFANVNGATGMGAATISAANSLRQQLVNLGLSNTKVGLTPMVIVLFHCILFRRLVKMTFPAKSSESRTHNKPSLLLKRILG